MNRRDILKAIGLGWSTALLARCRRESLSEELLNLRVGSVDLSDLEIIDVHLHQLRPITQSALIDSFKTGDADVLVPSYDFDGKAKLRTRREKDMKKHFSTVPSQTGICNYVARIYGVNPTIKDFDRVILQHSGDFPGYIRSILNREKISVLVLQSDDDPEPVVPTTPIPSNRFVWTWPFDRLIQPGWAKDKGCTDIHDLIQAIDQAIEKAAANKCRGLKTLMAYWRPLAIERVEESQANAALKSLLKKEPSGYGWRKEPQYEDPKLTKSLRSYQDYLIKYIYIKAGEVGLPIIIHVCSAYSPEMRCDWNNPIQLYEVFRDDDVLRAETQFILIHTGYPYHHLVSSLISRFPNVFTDVSFVTWLPGLLEETLRAFLSVAPSEKVMHASDTISIPDYLGYCASNTRRVLAKILNDFMSDYGWTEKDCEKIARNVMSENARRFFKIRG